LQAFLAHGLVDCVAEGLGKIVLESKPHAHSRLTERIFGNQWRIGKDGVEILIDDVRLVEHLAVVNECRHEPHRIEFQIGRLLLIHQAEIEPLDLEGQAFLK
jgi:hypothetical protein